MNRIFLLAFALILGFSWAEPPSSIEGWDLVFEDEFEGTSLNSEKWNSTYNWGHTHNHRAYCVAENVSVKDGFLQIKGEASRHPDAPETASNGGNTYSLDYTSGAIDTRGKFGVQYGYIEGRFKAPSQLGTWPAFWTLQDGWPPEIDILEIPHARTQHHYYLHYTDPSWYASNGSAWDHEASFGGTHSGPDKSTAFYNYGVEWDASTMNFYFNDSRIASYNRSSEISQTKEMYIIINLAIGGWAGDDIEVTANNPAYFEADWVRVWKRKSAFPDTVRIRSVATGKCMIYSDNALVLGDCFDEKAYVTLTSLGSNTYRINFGDKVFEIPNESKDAGAAAGIWGWNGKEHQQIVFEAQEGFTGYVVRMKMKHSSHYIRNDEDVVIQDWNDSWPWNQNWKIIVDDSELSTKNNALTKRQMQPSVLHRYGDKIQLVVGNSYSNQETFVRMVDLEGRQVFKQKVYKNLYLDLSSYTQGVYQIIVGEGSLSETFRILIH